MERKKLRNTKSSANQPAEKESILLYLHDIVYLLTGILLVLLLLFRIVVVSGPSMMDTLEDGDCLLLISHAVAGDPQYGDIVVAAKESFKDGEPIVKRVIATEGQTVDIDFAAGIVYVDGKALKEDYIRTPTYLAEGMTFPLVVEEGSLFVMGDNRGASMDSRDPKIGLIDTREVMGRAIFLVFPGKGVSDEGRNFGRIGVLK